MEGYLRHCGDVTFHFSEILQSDMKKGKDEEKNGMREAEISIENLFLRHSIKDFTCIFLVNAFKYLVIIDHSMFYMELET